MKIDYHIQGGRVIDPATDFDAICDLWITDGKIYYKPPSKTTKSVFKKTINASGKIIMPGLIDLRCHIRNTTKEIIKATCKAAADGGYTSILAMPDFTPTADNAGSITLIKNTVKKESSINLMLSGCLTQNAEGRQLAPLGSLKESGVVAVTDCPKSPQDNEIFSKCIEYSKMFDLPVIDLPREITLSRNGSAHDGVTALKMGLTGIPRIAEELFVQRAIILSKQINTKIHLSSISSFGSVELLKKAKSQKINITADITPHHLCLTDSSIVGYETNAKTMPPLREEKDRKALLEGLLDGSIDGICSSHESFPEYYKNVEFDKAPFGITSYETALPVVHAALNKITDSTTLLLRISKWMSYNPAKILNLDKGSLKTGKDADLMIYDENEEWEFQHSNVYDRYINSPFTGKRQKGKVIATFVGGRCIFGDRNT